MIASILLLAAFEIHALVDSLDFATVVDIEKPEGTVKTLEHVLGTYPTSVLWRDKSGGQVRYPSAEEKSIYCENPLNKLQFWRYSVYGDLRQHNRCTNAFEIVRDECVRRGFEFGVHSGWEDSHSGAPWTESNWVMAHPQYSTRALHGPVRIVSSSIAYPEVVRHRVAKVDELLAYGAKTIFLDMRRRGGWGPRFEYVEPMIAEWRRRYDCEPPSDYTDERWISLVSEHITGCLREMSAHCHAKGCRLLVGLMQFEVDDTYTWRELALDWKKLAQEGIADGIVLMDVKCDPGRPFESTEEILRWAKANCGDADLYFHASVYGDESEAGLTYYSEHGGVSREDAARRLLTMAEDVGCAGAILAVVDYGNYTPAICEAISEHSPKAGGVVTRWTGGTGTWTEAANWSDDAAPDASDAVAEFRGSANVTLDGSGATDLSRLIVRGYSSKVTVTAAEGATLRFTPQSGAAADRGICVDSGSTLVLDAPVETEGEFAVSGGGTVQVKSTLKAASISASVPVVFDSGSELVLTEDCTWDTENWTAASGACLTLAADHPVTVTVPDGLVLPDALTIGTNLTVRIPSGRSVFARPGVVPSLDIRAGGRLHLADYTSHVATPVDLSIETGGQVHFEGRMMLVARRFTRAGEVQPYGFHSAADAADAMIRGLGGNQAAVVVPYSWTGAGNGSGWNDPANWEGGVVPPADGPVPVDFSRATTDTIRLSSDVTVSAVSYLPSAADTLTFVADAEDVTFGIRAPGNYAPVLFVSRGRTVVFDVDFANSLGYNLNIFAGGGTVRTKRRYRPNAPDSQNTASWLIVDGCLEVGGRWEGVNYCAARNGSSAQAETVFVDGADVDFANVLSANFSGYTNLERLRQEGGDVTAKSLHVMTYRTSDTHMTYTLNGGSLTLTEGVHLGALNPCFPAPGGNPRAGGDFIMTGGVLTTSLMTTELNSNWYRLSGGTVRLGSGGIVKGTAELVQSVPNATPGLEFGGVTFVADTSWTSASELAIALTGVNGPTAFDVTDGETVTLAGPISGTGGLVKRGAGTLRFGAFAAAGTLRVEEGAVALARADDLTGTDLRVPSLAAVSVEEGEVLPVRRLYIKDIPKQPGSYAVNGGTLVVSDVEVIPLTLGEAVNAPELDWYAEGAPGWFPEWNECAADERHAARSGAIADGERTVLGVRFSGKGVFAFDWRTSSEAKFDAVRLEVDGETICPLSGETDWQTMSLDLDFGEHEIRWTYQKNRTGRAGEDAAWVDNVSWTVAPEPTLAEALDSDEGLVWTTGGDAPWEPIRTRAAYAGRDCALSGDIGDLGFSWIETAVSGAGHLAFAWAVSCEDGYDWLELEVDGSVVRSLTGTTDWREVGLDLDEGDHVIRWTYWKDEYTDEDLAGADCALLDYVRWTPAHDYLETDYGTVEVSVFYDWLKANRCVAEPTVSPTREERIDLTAKMAFAPSAKGKPLMADYVAGTDPNDEKSVFAATVEMKDGEPVIGWTPTTEGRVYQIWGSNDLIDWRKIDASVGSGYRFFKVTVNLAP